MVQERVTIQEAVRRLAETSTDSTGEITILETQARVSKSTRNKIRV